MIDNEALSTSFNEVIRMHDTSNSYILYIIIRHADCYAAMIGGALFSLMTM